MTLLDALREYAGLTGTRKGGDHGRCGACTVLIDGRRINSCLTLGVRHAGKQITTVEGLAWGDGSSRPGQWFRQPLRIVDRNRLVSWSGARENP